ncbi:Protein HMG-1.1 [Aphelenchoides avenae]|nr:Protein HMG-1.1 [Aphelenchus avenae]
MADVEFIKPFLKLPAVMPTTAANVIMKEVSRTGGWEINVEDTSTLTFTHMHCIMDVIASRERQLRSRQQAPRQQQRPAVTRAQPRQEQAPRQEQYPADNASPHPPVTLGDVFAAPPAFVPAKKPGRKPKDPNAPKHPLNAFFLWLKETRQQLAQPGMRVTDEKERWQQRASEEKQRYNRELAEYLREMRDKA